MLHSLLEHTLSKDVFSLHLTPPPTAPSSTRSTTSSTINSDASCTLQAGRHLSHCRASIVQYGRLSLGYYPIPCDVPLQQTEGQISPMSVLPAAGVAFSVASCSHNRHDDTTELLFRLLLTEHISSPSSIVANIAHRFVRFKPSRNCRKPTFVIYKLPALFRLKLVHALICQFNNLTCSSALEKGAVFEVNARPFHLFQMTVRNVLCMLLIVSKRLKLLI